MTYDRDTVLGGDVDLNENALDASPVDAQFVEFECELGGVDGLDAEEVGDFENLLALVGLEMANHVPLHVGWHLHERAALFIITATMTALVRSSST